MSKNRYEIIGNLGCGATSRVDKARDTVLGRTVALKTLVHSFGAPTEQKQFLREAQIVSQLSHPAIVNLYDVGIEDGNVAYLVMEYVAGKTLQQVLSESTGAIPVARACAWASDLAGALHRAHRACIGRGQNIGRDQISVFRPLTIADAERVDRNGDTTALGHRLGEAELPIIGVAKVEIALRHAAARQAKEHHRPGRKPLRRGQHDLDTDTAYAAGASRIRQDQFVANPRDVDHSTPFAFRPQYRIAFAGMLYPLPLAGPLAKGLTRRTQRFSASQRAQRLRWAHAIPAAARYDSIRTRSVMSILTRIQMYISSFAISLAHQGRALVRFRYGQRFPNHYSRRDPAAGEVGHIPSSQKET